MRRPSTSHVHACALARQHACGRFLCDIVTRARLPSDALAKTHNRSTCLFLLPNVATIGRPHGGTPTDTRPHATRAARAARNLLPNTCAGENHAWQVRMQLALTCERVWRRRAHVQCRKSVTWLLACCVGLAGKLALRWQARVCAPSASKICYLFAMSTAV